MGVPLLTFISIHHNGIVDIHVLFGQGGDAIDNTGNVTAFLRFDGLKQGKKEK
jgi:hypothetical protein